MTESDELLLEAAAMSIAAVAKHPVTFWVKFWEALWNIQD